MNVMTKRGSLDNQITYEHYCDTKTDLENIPKNEITLGTVAVVLKDDDNSMGIYIADSNKEWNSFSSGGSSAEIELEELTITENGSYSAGAGKGFSKVDVEVKELDTPLLIGGNLSSIQFSAYGNSLLGSITAAHFPECSVIGSSAFNGCGSLASISFPACTSIGDNAFNYCRKLSAASFPVCTTIGTSAFYYCDELTTVSFPVCTSIGVYAFAYCSNLTSVDFPACSIVQPSAFRLCSNLTTVNFPACSIINTYAFEQCKKLATVSFPLCSLISNSAFRSCFNLENASFPECEQIGELAFSDCWKITNASFPKCRAIYSNAFAYCSSMETAYFPNCMEIKGGAFGSCHALMSAYFLASGVPGMTGYSTYGSPFYETPISDYTQATGGIHGSIFVRASLLTDFRAASGWSDYADRIVGLTDEEIAALNF